MGSMARASRLAAIDKLLRERGSLTAKQVAHELGWPSATAAHWLDIGRVNNRVERDGSTRPATWSARRR